MRNVIGEPGGIYHAIVGTLLITLAATVISVPSCGRSKAHGRRRASAVRSPWNRTAVISVRD